MGLLAAFGLARIAALSPAKPAAQWGVGALALAALVHGATRGDARFVARADGWSPTEILGGAGALGLVPPRAVVLCQSDDLCGGAMYAQYVEGERPDVSVLPRQHLWDAATWRRLRMPDALRAAAPSVVGRAHHEANALRLRWLAATFRGQIRWQPGAIDEEQLARVRLGTGESPVLATTDGVVRPSDLDAWSWLAPRTTEGTWSRRLAAVVLSSTARRVLPEDRARAVELLRRAVAVDDTYATPLVNLGVLAAGDGRDDEAQRWFERAVRADPERVTAWSRLAPMYERAGRTKEAAAARVEAQRRAPR